MNKTNKQMKQWIDANAALTLGQLTLEDARMWQRLAEDDTCNYLRHAEDAFKARRQHFHLPPPDSKMEFDAFLMEFRIKIQLVCDQFEELPRVPLFDFGGATLYESKPFKLLQLMYLDQGGAA